MEYQLSSLNYYLFTMPRYVPHTSVRGIEAPIGKDAINNFNDKLTHIVPRSFSVFKSIKIKNKTIKDLEFLISCYPHAPAPLCYFCL